MHLSLENVRVHEIDHVYFFFALRRIDLHIHAVGKKSFCGLLGYSQEAVDIEHCR